MNEKNSNTSKIDLNQLTLPELMDLRDRVESKVEEYLSILRPVGKDDVAVSFRFTARTRDGVLRDERGDFVLASVLCDSISMTGPQMLEENVHHRVFTPLSTSLEEAISSREVEG